jgi:hypothetical protein
VTPARYMLNTATRKALPQEPAAVFSSFIFAS